ncbi:hypothetical protein [Caballeronia sp. DA-9]
MLILFAREKGAGDTASGIAANQAKKGGARGSAANTGVQGAAG